MSGFGGFSQEAYDQLRQSYAQQLLKAEEAENAGVTIGQDRLGLETAPLRSPWLDKTGLWQYPDGRGDHLDVQKKQVDLLAALQKEDEEEDVDLSTMSDEEIDSLIDEVLAEIDDGEDEVEEDDEEMSDEEIEALVNEVLSRVNGDDDLNLEDMSDDELDSMIDEILAEVESDEEAQAADLEDEEPDANDIAARIAELKAELAALTEDSEEEDDEEEEAGEASESEDAYETNDDDEETESEDDTDEEEPSDDESD